MKTQRTSEYEYLTQYYEKEGSQILVLYGGFGFGKTTLVREFGADKPFYYYRARSCSDREQRFEWGNELRGEDSTLPKYPEYADLFASLTKVRSRKRILVIDEFQHLVKGDSEFISQLITFVKNRWDNQQLMVILVSSSVGWVENSMIKKMGAAAFELSGLLKMKELSFECLKEFMPDTDRTQLTEIYGITGGVPYYWSFFKGASNMKEAVCKQLLNPAGTLYGEAERIVSEELRELAVYNTILASIASGMQKLNALYLHTGFSRAKISVYLKNLMELELVEKVFSFDSDGKANTQKGIYRIKNRFVHFYYKFLFPNQSRLESMESGAFYDTYIAPSFSGFAQTAFRDVCMEYLTRTFEFDRIGEWVGKTGSIDIVAEDVNGRMAVGLCHFDKRNITPEDLEWLYFCTEKAKIVPDEIFLFSLQDYDEKMTEYVREKGNIHLLTIQDICS